jgi:hypothetical protein
MKDKERWGHSIVTYTYDIPERTVASLEAYRDLRRPVGGFLRSVIEDRLSAAYGRADSDNAKALGDIVRWVQNELPVKAVGVGNYERWLK